MVAKKPEDSSSATAIMDAVRKKFGAASAVIPGHNEGQSEVRSVIPSGIDVVDRFVMGLGGSAVGRVTELFSAEGGGKTTFTWSTIGAHTAAGGECVYCDNEQSFDADRAAKFGVDPKKLVLLQPFTLEEAMEMQLMALEAHKPRKGKPLLMAWDSIAGSQYENEVAGNFSKPVQDSRAAKLGSFCRQAAILAAQKQVHLLFVNQERMLRGVMFGPNTTTPGGKAVKYVASLRLQLFSGKALKDSRGLHIGKTITFMAVKTRFSPPFRKAKVRLYYDFGWDNCWSTVNHAKDLAVIPKELKADQKATYERAVEALGWHKTGLPGSQPPGPWKLLPPEGEVTDEADEAEWAGEEDEDQLE